MKYSTSAPESYTLDLYVVQLQHSQEVNTKTSVKGLDLFSGQMELVNWVWSCGTFKLSDFILAFTLEHKVEIAYCNISNHDHFFCERSPFLKCQMRSCAFVEW